MDGHGDAIPGEQPAVEVAPQLMSANDFVQKYHLYSNDTIVLYNLLRDLMLKKDCRHLEVVDGQQWGESRYLLVGATKAIQRKVYVPIPASGDIDFGWLHALHRRVQNSSEGMQCGITLCIYDHDSIIYEEILTELPNSKSAKN